MKNEPCVVSLLAIDVSIAYEVRIPLLDAPLIRNCLFAVVVGEEMSSELALHHDLAFFRSVPHDTVRFLLDGKRHF
jgi:hypothetical protein